MPFPIAIRSQHQLRDELYPVVLGPESALPVALSAEDGAIRDLVSRSMSVRLQHNGHVRDAMSVRRGGVDVLVTDARVILMGARQTPDSMLTGHVLLDWIVAVGGSSVRGLFRDDALRLVLQMDGGDYRVVTLTFDSDADVHEIAQDIARRTAARHLAARPGGVREGVWQAMAAVGRKHAADGEFALHWMPSHVVVPDPVAPERLGVPA